MQIWQMMYFVTGMSIILIVAAFVLYTIIRKD